VAVVTVRLPTALRPFSGGRSSVAVDAGADATIADVLASMVRICPGVVDRVLDEQGALRRHVNLYVGDEDARVLGGLDAVVPDGAEISILPAVSGGCAT
jgi:molybdopterin converting factor small subunit